MGLYVDVVLSDMAEQNQGIWKLFDIHASRYSPIKGFSEHPRDNTRKLYFSPDPPHILKNLRDHLTNNQKIIIQTEFVKKYDLPSNVVNIEHIKKLLELDSNLVLKLTPYLKESCIKPSHFEKMKVGLALRLLNHDPQASSTPRG